MAPAPVTTAPFTARSTSAAANADDSGGADDQSRDDQAATPLVTDVPDAPPMIGPLLDDGPMDEDDPETGEAGQAPERPTATVFGHQNMEVRGRARYTCVRT